MNRTHEQIKQLLIVGVVISLAGATLAAGMQPEMELVDSALGGQLLQETGSVGGYFAGLFIAGISGMILTAGSIGKAVELALIATKLPG